MDSAVLKLVLTPALIGTASLVGRRWGAAASGWLVGLPFTSAPVALFLALDHGAPFAATAAAGTMAGAISQAAFCVAYGRLASRAGWCLALTAGCLAFAIATAALRQLALPLPPLFLMVVAALAVALRLVPRGETPATAVAPLPRWDIPARMAVATAFVLLLTSAATALGPHLTGLLAPFPLYAAILALFAHRHEGAAPAVSVLRGLLLGLFAFTAFFLVLAALLTRWGLAPAFVGATAVALGVQASSLWALPRRPSARAPRASG